MSAPEFFQTLMGKRFYEHTMPELVRQLDQLNKCLATKVFPDQTRVAAEYEAAANKQEGRAEHLQARLTDAIGLLRVIHAEYTGTRELQEVHLQAIQEFLAT